MNVVAFVLRAVQLARSYGLTVTFEPGWETRGNGYRGRYVGVVVHHTASVSSLTSPFPTRRILRDGRSDLPGPLCNSAGPADGSIHIMAAQAANHAGASGGRSMGPLPTTTLFNPVVWGHEVDYSGTTPMLPGQYRAATVWSLALLQALREAGQIPAVDPQRVRGHAETSVTGKWDPGYAPGRTIDMTGFRASVQSPPPIPRPMKEEDMQLIKGDRAPNTFVVYWNQPGTIAVRKHIPNGSDPGYLAARAAGYEVVTVPQAVIDAIPDATWQPLPPPPAVDLTPIIDYLTANPPVAGVSPADVAVIAEAVVAELKKEGN